MKRIVDMTPGELNEACKTRMAEFDCKLPTRKHRTAWQKRLDKSYRVKPLPTRPRNKPR